MVYPAKPEPIVIVVVAIDVIVCFGMAAWFAWRSLTGQMPMFFLFFGASLVATSLFASWVLLRSSYEIEGGELVVRQGPNRQRIPVSSIDEIFPTKDNPLSPKWAGDRLQVMFVPGTKAKTLFLHPDDRSGFLQALSEADPGLSYDGQRLTRGAPS